MRGRDFRMADKNKTRKPMTSQRKGLIALIVMLVLTVCVSYLAVAGMKLDADGVNVLLPWVPVTAGNVPASLTMGLDLSEGGNHEISYSLVTPAPTAAPTAAPVTETEAAPEGGNGSAGTEEAGATDAPATVEGTVEAAQEAVENAAAEVTEAAQDAAAAVEGTVEAAQEAVENAAAEVTEAAQEAVEAVVEATAEPAPTATPIPASFRSELENAAEIIRKRVSAMGRDCKVEITNDRSLKVSYPNYVNVNENENVAEAIALCAEMPGYVTVRDESGNVLTDENGNSLLNNTSFAGFNVDYITYSGTSLYRTILRLTKEGRAAVEGLTNPGDVYLYLDNTQMATIGNIYNDGRIYLSFGNAASANAYGAIMTNAPLTVTRAAVSEAESKVTYGALHAILIVMWLVVLCAAVWMVLRNRLAGLGMAWGLWLFVVFFFFLLATIALPTLTVFNWVAVILSVCAAAYVGLVQLKGMDEAIAAGRDARGAVRGGFHATIKQVMIIHGIWLALSLVLMILPWTRHFGYILCCGMIASLAAVVGLSRWFVPCLVIVGGSKRGHVSAKAGK